MKSTQKTLASTIGSHRGSQTRGNSLHAGRLRVTSPGPLNRMQLGGSFNFFMSGIQSKLDAQNQL